MIKYPCILIAMLVVMMVLLSSAAHSYPVVVKDALNRAVEIKSAPERVVSLSPSITEIMASLGLLDKLVGVDSISYNDPYYGIANYCRTHNVADVGGYWWSTIKTEKILALKPDLILADAGAHVRLLKFFEDYNLTVVYLHAGASKSLEDIYSDIDMIASIFNVSKTRVSRLVQSIENNISLARQFIAPYKSVRAVVVVGFYEGIWVAGKATFVDDLLSKIGITNVATTIGWKAVNIETIMSWKPQIVIIDTACVTNKTLTEYGLNKINAKLVFLNKTEVDLLSRPGPLIGEASVLLAKRIANALGPISTPTPVTKTIVSTRSHTVVKTSVTTVTKEYASIATITSTKTVQQPPSYGEIIGVSIAIIIIGITIGYAIGKRH